MTSFKLLLTALLSLFLVGLASPAHAGPCFQYTVFESFEGSGNAGWNPWNSSVGGNIVIGADSGAISGTRDVAMSFPFGEPTSSFLVVDKTVSVTSATMRLATNAPGCNSIVPWPPVGNPVSCTAFAYVKPSGSASGLVELIDPATYIIDAQKTFSLSSSTTWQAVVLPTVSSCQKSMVVRVEMDHPVLRTTGFMYADAVFTTWNYN